MLRQLIAVALLCLCAAVARATPTVPMPGEHDPVAVGPYAEVLEDPAGKLTLADVAAANGFVPLARRIPNFGYTYSAFWLRFRLPPDPGAMVAPFLNLEIRFPSIDYIELDVPYRTAQGIEYRTQRGGDQLPWDARAVKHRSHVFRIPFAGLADAPVYLRVQTESVLTVPVFLWRPDAMAAADRDSQLGYGLFYGWSSRCSSTTSCC